MKAALAVLTALSALWHVHVPVPAAGLTLAVPVPVMIAVLELAALAGLLRWPCWPSAASVPHRGRARHGPPRLEVPCDGIEAGHPVIHPVLDRRAAAVAVWSGWVGLGGCAASAWCSRCRASWRAGTWTPRSRCRSASRRTARTRSARG